MRCKHSLLGKSSLTQQILLIHMLVQFYRYSESLITMRVTKGRRVLPLYKISVLLKTGDAGGFIITRKGPFTHTAMRRAVRQCDQRKK